MARDTTCSRFYFNAADIINNALDALAVSQIAVSDGNNQSLTIENRQKANQIYCYFQRAFLANKTTSIDLKTAKGNFGAIRANSPEHNCMLMQLAQSAMQFVTSQCVLKFYQTIRTRRILPIICNSNKFENLQTIDMELQRLVSHHQCLNLMGIALDG